MITNYIRKKIIDDWSGKRPELAEKSEVNESTLSRLVNEEDYDLKTGTAERILKAMGKKITIS